MSEKNGYKVTNFTLFEPGVGKILKSGEMENALHQYAGKVGTGEVLFTLRGDRVKLLVATGEEIKNDN